MEIEKGKTAKYLREQRVVPQSVKDELKSFTRIKKSILDALQEGDQTIAQLSLRLNIPRHEVVYNLMSLIKFGFVQTGDIDDMDEYFSYKLKK